MEERGSVSPGGASQNQKMGGGSDGPGQGDPARTIRTNPIFQNLEMAPADGHGRLAKRFLGLPKLQNEDKPFLPNPQEGFFQGNSKSLGG